MRDRHQDWDSFGRVLKPLIYILSNSKFMTGLQEPASAITLRVLQSLDTTAIVSLPGGQRQAPCDGPMHEDGNVMAFLISVSGGILR